MPCLVQSYTLQWSQCSYKLHSLPSHKHSVYMHTYRLLFHINLAQTVAPLIQSFRCNTSFGYCSSTASLPVRPHCANVRWIRCQADLNSFRLGELEETTGTSPYHVDEDYPAGPEINEPLPQWSNWRGSAVSIVHSGDWCRHLALSTHSGACQKWMSEVHYK